MCPVGARFPVVFFDLDGTLLRRTSVSVLLADRLGRAGALDELERQYREGLISNAVVAETTAGWFAGQHVDGVAEALDAGTWLDGISEVVDELRRAGSVPVLATVTWRFAAELVAIRYGFAGLLRHGDGGKSREAGREGQSELRRQRQGGVRRGGMRAPRRAGERGGGSGRLPQRPPDVRPGRLLHRAQCRLLRARCRDDGD